MGRHGVTRARHGLARLTERLQDLELMAAASLGRLDVRPRGVGLCQRQDRAALATRP